MIDHLKRARLFALAMPLLLIGLVSISGCGGSSSNSGTKARFVNAIYSSAATLTYSGGTIALNNNPLLQYGSATYYIPIPSATDVFTLTLQSFPTYSTSLSESINANGYYSFTACGRTDVAATDPRYPEMIFVGDDRTLPGTGNTRLRVINAACDSGNVDVFRNSNTVVLAQTYGTGSSYQEFGGGNYTITVNTAGTSKQLVSTSVTLNTGQLYTLTLIENPTTTPPTYSALVTNDSNAD